jgi:hypothetical protein
MISVKALAACLGVAIAATAVCTGCVVTPEPIPLFDGKPWAPSSDMDKVGGWDAHAGLDSGYAPPDSGVWGHPDGQPDGAPDASTLDASTLVDGQPDALDDSAQPGEGGAPSEVGPISDAVSPTFDGLAGDVVLQE